MPNNEVRVHEKKHINYKELFFQYTGLISLIIFILIIGFGYLFIIKSRVDFVQINLKKEIEGLEQRNKILVGQFSEMQSLQEEYDKIDKKLLDKVSLMVSEKSDYESVMSDIEGRMSEYDVVMKSLTKGEDTSTKSISRSTSKKEKENSGLLKGLNQMNFKVDLIGPDYSMFKNILAMFERNLRVMDVENVSFSPSSKSVNLDFSVYYINLDELTEEGFDIDKKNELENNSQFKSMMYKDIEEINVSEVKKSNQRLFYPPVNVESQEDE